LDEYQDPWNIGTHYATLKEHAEGYVDMAPHVDTLVRLASECNTILELGVRSGVSSWAFLTGLPKDGTLYAVDIDSRIMDDKWLPPQVAEDDRFIYTEGDDLDPFLVIAYPSRPDLVFIDSSHEYVHTYAELIMAAGLKASRIVLHDYNLEQVRLAIQDFRAFHSEYEIELVEDSQWGLVVLRNYYL
jgi:predicted O-methyltransferase YrrM